jgi:hypothetical protein
VDAGYVQRNVSIVRRQLNSIREAAMRFKSKKVGGYQVYAVSGINTVSFGIDAKDANTGGLLGFGVERRDVKEGHRYFMYGFKVFRSVVPVPIVNLIRWRARTNRAMLLPDVGRLQSNLVAADRAVPIEGDT